MNNFLILTDDLIGETCTFFLKSGQSPTLGPIEFIRKNLVCGPDFCLTKSDISGYKLHNLCNSEV